MNDSPLSKTFLESVARQNLVQASETVLIAVSGGVDSVVLLHLILRLPPDLRPRMTVAHYNHRLRGNDSEQDAAFVKDLCARWEIPFHYGEAPSWTSFSNVEARARSLRYDFLKSAAHGLGLAKILLAHHADDQAENFLIRWLQGAGLRGLAGMTACRQDEGEKRTFVRPLLRISRREIETYAREQGLPFRIDATNESPDFLRNRVRILLRDLKKENDRLPETAALNALFLQADQSYLEKEVGAVFEREAELGSETVQLPLPVYRTLEKAIQYRLLQKMSRQLIGAGYALPGDCILRIESFLNDSTPQGRLDLPSGLVFEKDYVWLRLRRKTK